MCLLNEECDAREKRLLRTSSITGALVAVVVASAQFLRLHLHLDSAFDANLFDLVQGASIGILLGVSVACLLCVARRRRRQTQ